MMEKVVILHSDVPPDASEDELDCLRQAETISGALRQLDYEPILLPFVLDLSKTIDALTSLRPHFVFNLVETINAKGSLIYFAPALLDYLNIPYTGSDTDAIYLTSNKPLAKELMQAAGVATPAWISPKGISSGQAPSATFLLKSVWEHASVGLNEESIISLDTATDILSIMKDRQKKISGNCFAEAYIDGREFNMALIAGKSGCITLPVAEILFRDYAPDKLKIVDYNAKWVEGSFEYENTSRTMEFPKDDAGLIAELQEIAKKCWKLFALRGYARVDFRVDKNGKPWVLEINANPCLTLEAGFAFAMEKASLKYHEGIALIIDDALRGF